MALLISPALVVSERGYTCIIIHTYDHKWYTLGDAITPMHVFRTQQAASSVMQLMVSVSSFPAPRLADLTGTACIRHESVTSAEARPTSDRPHHAGIAADVSVESGLDHGTAPAELFDWFCMLPKCRQGFLLFGVGVRDRPVSQVVDCPQSSGVNQRR